MLRHRPVPLSGSNPSVTSTLDAHPTNPMRLPLGPAQTDRQTQGTAGNPAGGPGDPAGCGPARAAGSWVGSCHRDALSRSLCSSAQHPRHRQKLETLTVGRVHSQPALAPGASDLKTRRQMAFFFLLVPAKVVAWISVRPVFAFCHESGVSLRPLQSSGTSEASSSFSGRSVSWSQICLALKPNHFKRSVSLLSPPASSSVSLLTGCVVPVPA